MYAAPRSLEDALDLRAERGLAPLAGGTDFFPALGEDRVEAADALDITGIDVLRGVERVDGGWRIGAAATWTDVMEAGLPPAFRGLNLAAREVGGIQIQNAATVVGNLCNASPAADGVPPLLTLDAELELASIRGARRLRLDAFILGPRNTALAPDEIVTAVILPDPSPAARASFHKLGARTYLVISIAMTAALIIPGPDGEVAQARVAVGACSPVALRLPALESALVGAMFDARSLAERVEPGQLAALAPIDDIRGTGTYRLQAVEESLRRVLSDAAESLRGAN